jgi:cytochrome oxidase Cu insertion factor (SCO1/SenC/PrrC family)
LVLANRSTEKEGVLKHRALNIYLAAVILVSLAWAPTARAQQAQQAQPLMTKVKVGDPAPDFTLSDQNNKQVKLSDFKGQKNVVLAFYVLAFTGG